jgi:hypothetical protein
MPSIATRIVLTSTQDTTFSAEKIRDARRHEIGRDANRRDASSEIQINPREASGNTRHDTGKPTPSIATLIATPTQHTTFMKVSLGMPYNTTLKTRRQ